MARIPEEVINEIIDKTDIVDIVSEYVSLEKKGKSYSGLCPFHNDNKPSFSVSPEKKIFKCFSCGAAGGVVKFVQDIKMISYPEALAELAAKAGVKIDILSSNESKDRFSEYYKINEKTSLFYQLFLTNNKSGNEALDYLHNRGLDTSTIKMFNIGFAPNKRSELYNMLSSEFVQDDMFIELGLVKENKGFFDTYRDRIIFPLIDEKNNVVGFSARLYKENSSQPKYMNSPQNIIFNKSNILYNLNNALMHIRKNKRIVILEGFMDVIAMHRAGIYECVATMGTALTNEHLTKISKLTKEVVICYDGDTAGIEATRKAIELFKRINIIPQIIVLPDNLDPDDYINRYSKEKFVSFFESEQIDIYNFEYKYMKSQYDLSKISDIEKFKYKVFDFVVKSDSSIVINKYIKNLCEDIDIDIDTIRDDYRQHIKNVKFDIQYKPKPIVSIEKNISNKYQNAERTILKYLLNSKKYYIQYLQKFNDFGDLYFIDHKILDIRLFLFEYYDMHSKYIEKKFYEMLNESEINYIETYIKNLLPIVEEDYTECLNVYYDYFTVVNEYKEYSQNSKESMSKEEKIKFAEKRDRLKKDKFL